MNRQTCLAYLEQAHDVDVVVLGGGINGACLYDRLCRQGYRVVLLDRSDFAAGTSQASGMMVWGGLLYLKNLHLASVWSLSRERDRLLAQQAQWVKPASMRYVCSPGGRAQAFMHCGLWLYWLMGGGRRHTPRAESRFKEQALLQPGLATGSLLYEEAFLEQSDAGFVMRWLAPHQSPSHMALNYCEAQSAVYCAADKRWHMDLHDRLSGRSYQLRAAMVVNCTGIWSDRVNATFGIESPFRHVLSKGVYLGLPRHAEHQNSLFFDMGEHDDVITHVPWGPVALWGPTETAVASVEEGHTVTDDDVDFLLEHYARRYRQPLSRQDIVSVRCGIRPLVVHKDEKTDGVYPLDLSRRQEMVRDPHRPWISCYGGKMTDCMAMAHKVEKMLARSVQATGQKSAPAQVHTKPAELVDFPGLAQPVASATWCVENTMCCTLEDYLRRRTNISQWVHRAGLGKADVHAAAIKKAAFELAQGEQTRADAWFSAYTR
ncbi:MAG: FAD-dependent oxidoreductase, partial [Brachymonas sp.]|nr:FAD-dependent oxidoreductase [Brachymonas sp.]